MKIYKYFTMFVLSLVLAACGSGQQIDLSLLGKGPKYLPMGATCTANVKESNSSNTIAVQVDSFEYIEEGNQFKEVIFRYTDPRSTIPQHISVTRYDIAFNRPPVTNLQELANCLAQYSSSWIEQSQSIIPTVPATSGAIQQLPQSQPSPFEPQYFIMWNNGIAERVGSEAEAQQKLNSSWEGGQIQKVIGGVTTQVGSAVSKFSAPNGPNGTPITLGSPQAPYFVNQVTGDAFATLEEAMADASTRENATEIKTFLRGVDMGVAQTVAQCAAVEAASQNGMTEVPLEDEYLRVTESTGTTTASYFYTLDNSEAAVQRLNKRTEGGQIDVLRRCGFVRIFSSVAPWSPDQQLVDAFGGSFSDVSQVYWVYNPAGTPMYFGDMRTAVVEAERYRNNFCSYPGGNVVPLVRGNPVTNGSVVSVVPWVCVQGLPQDWDANLLYYSRNGSYYPSLSKAISSDLLGWYLGFERQEINLFRREKALDLAPTVNWWVPWMWLVLGAVILYLILSQGYKYRHVLKDELMPKPRRPLTELEKRIVFQAKSELMRALLKMLKLVIGMLMIGVASYAGIKVIYFINAAADAGNFSYIGIIALIVIVTFLVEALLIKSAQRVNSSLENEK